MSFFSKLFSGEKPPDQREVLKKWTRELNRKIREIERDAEAIRREEVKLQAELKKGAKSNMSKTAMTSLAKAIVKGQKARERLLTSVTQIRSIGYELDHMVAQIRVSKILGTSTNLMRSMRAMMPIEAVQQTCIAMSKEMYKAGLIEETIDDTMSMMEDDDIEALTDKEVDNVLTDLLQGMLAKGEIKAEDNELASQLVQKQAKKEEDDMIAQLASM